MNPLDYDAWSFKCIVGLSLLIFCWEFLHLYSSMILACNFLFSVVSLYGFGISMRLASQSDFQSALFSMIFFRIFSEVYGLTLSLFFYCSGFCHTLKWNSHGFTCVPHPDPHPPHLPLHPIPLGLPSAPGPRACLMHPTWAGDLFHPRKYTCFNAVLLKHPTLAFSHRV